MTPPMKNLDPNVSFYKAGLTPASLVYLGSDTQHSGPWMQNVKMDVYPGQEQTATKPDVMPSDVFKNTPGHTLNEESSHPSLPSSNSAEKLNQQNSTTKKVPKWLKFSK
jgi:hypothetical protein